MSDTVDAASNRLGSLSTVGKVRYGLFTLLVLAILVLNVALTPPEVLGAGVLGWFETYGIHHVHDMVISSLLVFGVIVPVLLLLYHPSERVNTILAPVVAVGLVAVLAVEIDSFLATGFAVSAVLGVLAIALHPAGRSVLRFERVESFDWRVVGLYVVGAVPLLAYAGLELTKQVTTADEHALFVHYGAMAIVAFLAVLLGFMAIFRDRDWRFAVWTSGLLAGFLGIVSAAFPTIESSLGVLGGSLVFLWAIALVAGVEYTRRSESGSSTDPPTARERPSA